MPEAAELIADGVRAERAGALDRALEAFRAAAASDDPRFRSEALTHAADVLRARCEWDDAISSARAAAEVASLAGLHRCRAEANIAEANVFMCRGDFASAIPKFQDVSANGPDARLRGIALQNLGSIYAQTGEPSAAEQAFSESLARFQAARYSRGEAIALNNLGRLAMDSNATARARPLLERALRLALDVEDSDLASLASLNLASVLCSDGDLDRSQDLAMAALGYYSDCNNRWREIECFRLIGTINEKCEDVANAARCYELALSLAEQIGSEPEIRATRERLEALSKDARGSRPQPPSLDSAM